MSLTGVNDESQQGGAGQSGGTNGNEADNQGPPNQITQLTQDPDGSGGTVGIGGAATGVNHAVLTTGTGTRTTSGQPEPTTNFVGRELAGYGRQNCRLYVFEGRNTSCTKRDSREKF